MVRSAYYPAADGFAMGYSPTVDVIGRINGLRHALLHLNHLIVAARCWGRLRFR